MSPFGFKRSLSLCAFLCLAQTASAAQDLRPIEDPPKTDEFQQPRVLRGTVERVRVNSGSGLNRQEPSQEEGYAESAEEREITIEWDRWHNRVTHAIWSKFCTLLQGEDVISIFNVAIKLGNAPAPRFPLGTRATYSCTINDDQEVTDVKIVVSSGNSEFDDLIRRSVSSIDGKSFLRFPRDSRRKEVRSSAQLFTTRNGRFNELHFGDVERYSAMQSQD